MFYACLSVFVLVSIMCFCITLAIVNIDEYNFALYVVLLCIVGTLLACACAIANPDACHNPAFYVTFCMTLQDLNADRAPLGAASSRKPSTGGLRAQIAAMHAANAGDPKLPLRNDMRSTITMLAPAVQIMQHVWKGVAWVTDSIEHDDEGDGENGTTRSGELGDAALSSSPSSHKKLSTVIEHEDLDEASSSEFTSSYDVMV